MKYLNITREHAITLCQDVQVYGHTQLAGMYELAEPEWMAELSRGQLEGYFSSGPGPLQETFYIKVNDDDE